MELHSYAKRKVPKKWTIEHKRKLVDARIRYDALFEHKPTTSVVPWKKMLSLSKLDDYNVFFVRKQWSLMVARYKQYKQTRFGDVPPKAIDEDTVRQITDEEWEFFEPIHRFMTRKTNSLHSYALALQENHPPELLAANLNKTRGKRQQQQLNSTSSNENINIFSSDTNEDYAVALGNSNQFVTKNTDHDLYSKRAADAVHGHSHYYSYYADASEDTQESMIVELTTSGVMEAQEIIETKPELSFTEEVRTDNSATVKMEPAEENKTTAPSIGPTYMTQIHAERPTQQSQQKLSERDKYYRHKRRYNRRLERRFDALLNVFGQIVKAEYPSIDVSPLVGAAASSVQMASRLFSSDEEDEEEEASAAEE